MTTTHTLVNADPEVVEKIGKAFTEGVVSTLMKWFIIYCLAGAFLTASTLYLGHALGWSPPDDSDASWIGRSGMRPRADHLTGCEYLETRAGSLTPRLGRDGRQICRTPHA